MRSTAELRQRWLDLLPQMMACASLWARDGFGFDEHARRLLADLCFLDEREQHLAQVEEALRRFGQTGVAGPFITMFGRDRNCVGEVASVFAEQFHRMGYLKVQRLLDPDEWDRLVHSLQERFNGRDARYSEVVAMYGPPSLSIDRRVLCYASATEPGWVFFDCFADEHRRQYVPGAGRYDWYLDKDPLVRTVRYPAADFKSGLILTLYGRVLRQGPGWWLDHPERLTPEQQAVAAQLRQIRAADPSQAPHPSLENKDADV